MGKKKSNPSLRSKHSGSKQGTSSSQAFSTVKRDCKQAFDALKQGMHTRALKLMKEACFNYKSSAYSAFIHRLHGHLCLEVASILDDPSKKERHLKNAIESARKAVELSPCSIESAKLYATLLYNQANDSTEYEQVVKECGRALGITSPIDPAKESLEDESQQELPTAESRITHVQNQLRKLIQKSNIASLSTWARKNGIESLMNALRLLRQSKNKGGRDDSTSEKIDLVRSYWNSISPDLKKKFLRIEVSSLISHLGTPDESLLSKTALAAVSFAKRYKTWIVWLCCYCRKGFPDSKLHRQHLREHMGNFFPEMQGLLPQNVEDEWIPLIRHSSWEPLDASAAIEMLKHPNKLHVAYSLSDGWPLSDDSDRANLLKEIHVGFDRLIRHKYLAASHLDRVIKFAMDEIQKIAAGSQLLNLDLDKSPTCICFLGAPQLEKILGFLLDLSHACGMVINNADKSTNLMDDLHNSNQIAEIKVKIVLSEDASWLLLDEYLVSAEITPGATDPFVYWLFSESSRGNEVNLCIQTMKSNVHQGLELAQALNNEFHQLQSLSKKCERTNYEEALQLSEIDAEIMSSIAKMKRLELKFESVSSLDYGELLLILAKRYLRATLEDLAERDAAKKRDAAKEPFSVELAHDSEKDAKGESDGPKHAEKTENKKQNKKSRKTKNLKATHGDEQHVLDTTTLDSSSAVRDNDPDSTPLSTISDNLEQRRALLSETNLEKPDDEVLDPVESRPLTPGSEPSNE